MGAITQRTNHTNEVLNSLSADSMGYALVTHAPHGCEPCATNGGRIRGWTDADRATLRAYHDGLQEFERMEDEKSNEFKDELDAAILDRLSTTARLIGLLESKRDLLLDNNKLACMQAAEKATGIARAHIKARYDAIARRIILKCSRQIDYEMSKATANI